MRPVSSYTTLSPLELESELVTVTSVLTAEYQSLGAALSDYHRDFLNDYAQSVAGNVSGKNREAQYANMEAGSEILLQRAKIDSLILCRDLLVFLFLSQAPNSVPFPNIALDDDGLPAV